MKALEVAPFTGAWIEIRHANWDEYILAVAPFTGAWIEMIQSRHSLKAKSVAPFTGAWIEIDQTLLDYVVSSESLPSRERGLKFDHQDHGGHRLRVAPFTGAWIEICSTVRGRRG